MSETPAYVKNLKKESVVQSVINCLTDAMRSKELKPGDRIPPEPELAASMGVARSSVREAIKILSYLGVLESKRAEGTFVCSGFQESMIDPMIYGIILNQDSSENLMELREMVESGIMRLASAKYNEEAGRALAAILDQMTGIVQSGENVVDRFFEVDNAFHNLISQMGKNPLADKISRVVRTLTHAMRYETVATMLNTGRGEELIAAHRCLLETLQSRFSPALSRRAGELFSRLTDGKYESVLLDRTFSAQAGEAGESISHDAQLLSLGTLDQLYLAVRLAICESVLPEGDPPPIVLDDALVRFDDARCRAALDLLLEESKSRQILLFTCQHRESAYLAGRDGVTLLSL